MKTNPYKIDDKWYWFDETEELSHPYNTKEEAEKDLLEYARWLNGSGEDILN